MTLLDALRSYLQLASGLADVSAAKAKETAAALIAQTPDSTTMAPDAISSNIQAMAEDLVEQSKTNSEMVVGLVKTEVDRAVGRMGFVREEELAALRRHVQRLEDELMARSEQARDVANFAMGAATESARSAAATAKTAATTAAASAAQSVPLGASKASAAKRTPSAPTPAATSAKPAAKKAPVKEATSKPATKKAAAKKTAAKKTAAKKTAAKKTASKSTKKAPAKKAAKKSARK